MDSKATFIVGICGFLTSLALQLATLEHGWADATSPPFVASILGMVASFIATAYGGANFTTAAKADEMMKKAIDRVLEHQLATQAALNSQTMHATLAPPSQQPPIVLPPPEDPRS